MPSIFTRIIAGEVPGHFVWKDPQVVAMLTIEPFRDGHVMVIPREEIDHWDDMPEPLAARVMCVAQRIAKVQKPLFKPRRVGVMIAGMEVPHVHVHVVPINSLGELSFDYAHRVPDEQLAQTATRIREALRAAGHQEATF